MCVQAKAGGRGGEEMLSTGLPADFHELYSANWEPTFCLILQGIHLCWREEQREEFGRLHLSSQVSWQNPDWRQH